MGNDVKVDRALIQEALTAFGAQCKRMPACIECAFEGFGDCKMAFLLDYLAEHGHGMTAEPAADDRLGSLQEYVANELDTVRENYNRFAVEVPETLDEECFRMCKMNRAHGIIMALEAVNETIGEMRQAVEDVEDLETTEGGEA